MNAIFSRDRLYRYELHRPGEGRRRTAVIMVNPSTADETTDDATIRKVRGFGERYGFGKLLIGNLFAYRATDVRELGAVLDPVGPANDYHLKRMMGQADQVLFAWGRLEKIPPAYRERWKMIADIAESLGHEPLCLGTTMDGQPRHPLMLPYAFKPLKWSRP
jgi:hypothetical protein